MSSQNNSGFSRRNFMRGVGLGGGALGTGILEQDAQAQTSASVVGPGPVPVTLEVNGKPYPLKLEPRVTLLDALRDHLHLTGSKQSCGRGNCGSCTVLMAGKAVSACNVLAIEAQGKPIETIEGLAGARQHPLIAAFVKADAVQCGFCSPGFVMASKALLAKTPSPTEEQVKAGLAGNLCRCGAYVPLRKAVLEAARQMKGARNA